MINTTKGTTMIDILALLKRIETKGVIYDLSCCPECEGEAYEYGENFKFNKAHHNDGCPLKSAIDSLESGRLVVVEKPE
jgi:hypothetical protein